MAKVGRRPLDDQQLEGGIAGAGVGGTKWSSMPSFKGNASTVGDIKKMTADTSHLKGGAKAAADEAKGRAAKRTAVRAAGAAAAGIGARAAKEDAAAAGTAEDSFKEVERTLREVDADLEAEKYGKGDKMKSGGSVKGWGKARGARKAKIY
jgi:hypothetical protein